MAGLQDLVVFITMLYMNNFIHTQGAVCETPFEPITSGCYYFSVKHGLRSNFSDARLICRQLGAQVGKDADLAVLGRHCHDVEDLGAYVLSTGETHTWIGASDQGNENMWRWLDGRPVDMSASYWYYTEPNGGAQHNCAHFWRVDSTVGSRVPLADYTCELVIPFICQIGVEIRKQE